MYLRINKSFEHKKRLAGASLERPVQRRAIGKPVLRNGPLDVPHYEVGDDAARESEQVADARRDDVVDVRGVRSRGRRS